MTDLVHYICCDGCGRQLRVDGTVQCCGTWYGSDGPRVSRLRIGEPDAVVVCSPRGGVQE